MTGYQSRQYKLQLHWKVHIKRKNKLKKLLFGKRYLEKEGFLKE